MLTKTDEIRMLRDTAARLGAESYAGAWLADSLPDLEHLITIDYPIEQNVIGPRGAANLAREVLADARKTAASLIADAHSEADRITRTATERADADRDKARERLYSAVHAIEKLADDRL
jgi:cell division septum initiation protein DivIVA